jgi:hypothetical protein
MDSRKLTLTPGAPSKTGGSWSLTRGISILVVTNVNSTESRPTWTRACTGDSALGAMSEIWCRVPVSQRTAPSRVRRRAEAFRRSSTERRRSILTSTSSRVVYGGGAKHSRSNERTGEAMAQRPPPMSRTVSNMAMTLAGGTFARILCTC